MQPPNLEPAANAVSRVEPPAKNPWLAALKWTVVGCGGVAVLGMGSCRSTRTRPRRKPPAETRRQRGAVASPLTPARRRL